MKLVIFDDSFDFKSSSSASTRIERDSAQLAKPAISSDSRTAVCKISDHDLVR
jgi:hypothetical protein